MKKGKKSGRVSIRVCATPGGPCVESRSNDLLEAVAGVALVLGLGAAAYAAVKAASPPRLP